METWTGYSMSNAWLDIEPDDELLRLFVGDQLVYSIERSKQPMDVRVELLTKPEYALAFSFGDAEREGTFTARNFSSPAVDFLGTSLKVQRRPGGCWSLMELGDRPVSAAC
jgi:hypothetical protein